MRRAVLRLKPYPWPQQPAPPSALMALIPSLLSLKAGSVSLRLSVGRADYLRPQPNKENREGQQEDRSESQEPASFAATEFLPVTPRAVAPVHIGLLCSVAVQ